MSFSSAPLSWGSIMFGRFLLGLYFFVPGITKITAHAATLDYMNRHAVPFAEYLIWVAAIANLVGGAMLMTGRYVKLAAYGSALYVLIINLMMHNFWTMTGDEAAREGQNFVKNLAIFAGLLVVAGHAQAREISIREFWRSDRSQASK